MAHTVNRRHAPVGANTRASHGATIDPTSPTMGMYGLDMVPEPFTEPDLQGQLDGSVITDGSIGAEHLAALSVLNEALADNAVAQRNLQDLAVGSAEIQALAITTDKLAANAVTAAKILAGTITADKINADGLSANQITSGTLSVGGIPGAPNYIQVFDDLGQMVAQISKTSVLVLDTSDADNAVRLQGGVLEFSSDFSLGEDFCTWSTAISAAGITADAIKVGKAPGGHNLIPNASFESVPFSAGLTHTWPTDSAWGTLLAGSVNINSGGANLALTTATF